MGKLNGSICRPVLAVSAAVILAAAASASAHADGVVASSTSSAYDVGDRIASGARVRVETGAEVTVLDRSGATQRFSAPGGRYREPAAQTARSDGSRPSVVGQLALLFTRLGRRADLGSTRNTGDGCEPPAPGSRSIPDPACAAEAADEAWGFAIASEIEGFMSCDYAGADGVWQRLPLGLEGAPTPVGSGREYEFSSDDGAAWPDADADADIDVRCQAVDDATWFAIAPSWSADYGADEARALMESFAAVSGGTFTEAAVEE